MLLFEPLHSQTVIIKSKNILNTNLFTYYFFFFSPLKCVRQWALLTNALTIDYKIRWICSFFTTNSFLTKHRVLKASNWNIC